MGLSSQTGASYSHLKKRWKIKYINATRLKNLAQTNCLKCEFIAVKLP